MAKEGSVAPKERINIKYIPKTDGQKAEVELPLRLMVMGDFKGHREDTLLEERESVRIDKNTFGDVMKGANLKLDITVKDHLSDNPEEDATLPVSLNIDSLDDFSPDQIAKKVPELAKLLELREALVALKGPLGSAPRFRKKLQTLLDDKNFHGELTDEIKAMWKEKEVDEESVNS